MSCRILRVPNLAALLLAVLPLAQGTPFFLNMPDFYQHQKAGNNGANPGTNIAPFPPAPDAQPGNTPSYNPAFPPNATTRGTPLWWESGGGWCCISAYADAMYYMDTQLGFNGLGIHAAGHTWQEYMTYITEDLALGLFGLGGGGYPFSTVDGYITNYLGARASQIEHDIYTWDAPNTRVLKNGLPSAFGSMFNVVANYTQQGQAVNLRLTNGTGVWWNFHKVAVGGVDTATNTIYWADPDNTGHFNAGTNTWSGDKYAGAGWNHPYDSTDAFPVGPFYYQSGTLANGRTFDAGSFYAGANMFTVEVFDATPEPAPLLIIATGLCLIYAGRRRRSAALR